MAAADEVGLIERLLRSSEFKNSSRYKGYFHKSAANVPPREMSVKPIIHGTSSPSLMEMKTINIKELPRTCFRNESGALIEGTIRYRAQDESKLGNLTIGFHGGINPVTLEGVEINLLSIPNLFIDISHSGQKIKFGERCTGRWVFHLWGRADVCVGNDVTSNGMDVYLTDGSTLNVGDDCMFANGYIHVTDNHALFDMKTGSLLNVRSNPIVDIGHHVWLASRATIIGDAHIGAGSTIAAGAVVKGDVPPCSVAAGVPAKIVKRGVSWTRSDQGSGWEQVRDSLQAVSSAVS
ncbi:acyltransferase [Cupriavidus sp. U2]|uniref:acyltransferase n=1 Tax=Cupriavidus sp. U2 TaxID=2920269 RepID=UPI001892AD81|nr:acyltransferase [Cupriavidus sp. U2]